MKKILSFILVLAMVFCFAACGSESDNDAAGNLSGSMMDADNINEFTEGTALGEYDGVTLTAGVWEAEGDDFTIEFMVNNASEKDYEVLPLIEVNGIKIHSYQRFGISAGGDTGYFFKVPTSLMKEYGIDNIGAICVKFLIGNSDDSNGYAFISEYESEVFLIKIGNTDEMDTEIAADEYFYDQDGVKASVKFIESDIFTSLGLVYENETDSDMVIGLGKIVVNGEEQSYEGMESILVTDISANSAVFDVMALNNYTYDSETFEITKYDVESLVIALNINGEITEDIVLK